MNAIFTSFNSSPQTMREAANQSQQEIFDPGSFENQALHQAAQSLLTLPLPLKGGLRQYTGGSIHLYIVFTDSSRHYDPKTRSRRRRGAMSAVTACLSVGN